jgi:thymidine kinase
MAKLYFKWGVMNSGKSLEILSRNYNFKERGIGTLVMKSTLDIRDSNIIKSRALNTEEKCVPITPSDDVYKTIVRYIAARIEAGLPEIKWVIVDEAQFLTETQVDQLANIVDELDINVLCYGLRTDFQTKLFPGSKRLFEIADKFEEMRSTCRCGERASVNVRIDKDGKVVTEGPQVECGSEDKYITLCRKCYKKAIEDGHL